MAWGERSYEMPPDWWKTRAKVIKRDGGRCTWRLPSGKRCPRTEELEVDHKVQPMHGGTHHPDNLRTLCEHHHRIVTQQQAASGNIRYKNRKQPETHPGKGGTT